MPSLRAVRPRSVMPAALAVAMLLPASMGLTHAQAEPSTPTKAARKVKVERYVSVAITRHTSSRALNVRANGGGNGCGKPAFTLGYSNWTKAVVRYIPAKKRGTLDLFFDGDELFKAPIIRARIQLSERSRNGAKVILGVSKLNQTFAQAKFRYATPEGWSELVANGLLLEPAARVTVTLDRKGGASTLRTPQHAGDNHYLFPCFDPKGKRVFGKALVTPGPAMPMGATLRRVVKKRKKAN